MIILVILVEWVWSAISAKFLLFIYTIKYTFNAVPSVQKCGHLSMDREIRVEKAGNPTTDINKPEVMLQNEKQHKIEKLFITTNDLFERLESSF